MNSSFYRTARQDPYSLPAWGEPALRYINKGALVLDVGAGGGQISKLIKLKLDASVKAINLSKWDIKECKKKGIACYRVDIEKQHFPFKKNMFDTIIFLEVIEHLFNPYPPLKEIKRILKPKGSLILSTHNCYNLSMRLRFLFGQTPEPHLDVSNEKNLGQHIRLYNYRIIEKLLKNVGFVKIDFHPWINLPLFGIVYLPGFMKSLFSQHVFVVAFK